MSLKEEEDGYRVRGCLLEGDRFSLQMQSMQRSFFYLFICPCPPFSYPTLTDVLAQTQNHVFIFSPCTVTVCLYKSHMQTVWSGGKVSLKSRMSHLIIEWNILTDYTNKVQKWRMEFTQWNRVHLWRYAWWTGSTQAYMEFCDYER